MNYSTLKKTAALSIASLMIVAAANAQSSDSTKMSAGTSTAKVFGGSGQYRTFSVGINAGATSPNLATGGSNDFTKWKVSYGLGVSLKDQLTHAIGLQFDLHYGKVEGDNSRSGPGVVGGVRNGLSAFSTTVWNGSISGVVNLLSMDFLQRKDAVHFFANGGIGLAIYQPSVTFANGTVFTYGDDGGNAHVKELVIPVGVGVKFKLSDAMALSLGYTENFIDGDNFDGLKRNFPTKDKYSYAYAGLEFTLGSSSKPVLEWTNPVAMMYDELYDATLRKEVEALKGRVTNVESAVSDLKKDSDGDGVADQFDKCPNTPAGTVVDGSGCAIVFPKAAETAMAEGAAATGTAYANIQFEFDSSVLRTSSYPILDATSADLKATGKTSIVAGYASSEGTAAHNMRLSRDRANSVKTYLVNSGVDAKHLKIKAYGETHPIADNSTEEGRILNRRVEFK